MKLSITAILVALVGPVAFGQAVPRVQVEYDRFLDCTTYTAKGIPVSANARGVTCQLDLYAVHPGKQNDKPIRHVDVTFYLTGLGGDAGEAEIDTPFILDGKDRLKLRGGLGWDEQSKRTRVGLTLDADTFKKIVAAKRVEARILQTELDFGKSAIEALGEMAKAVKLTK